MSRRSEIGVLIALAVMGAGCAKAPPAAVTTAKPSPTPQLVEMGRQLYTKQCAVCHGATGAGDGQAAYLLYPKPRDFAQNEFRLVSTSTMQATDEDLFLTITRGMPGSAMPSWEALTPEQRWALVYYVRQLTGVTEPIDPTSVIQVPPETPTTAEGVARGRDIFAQACASCHGPQGRGDGQQLMIPPPAASAEGGSAQSAGPFGPAAGGGMTDNAGFPVKPRDLTRGVFKGSSESKDLYYRIVAGLPGSPMPSYAGVYTDEQLWDLIHYVQSLVPAGAEERVRLHHQTIRVHRVREELPTDPSADVWNAVQPTYVAVTPLWWPHALSGVGTADPDRAAIQVSRDDRRQGVGWRDHPTPYDVTDGDRSAIWPSVAAARRGHRAWDQRIEGHDVKALHNGKALAFHLSWDDPTRDESLMRPQDFSDGVAVQLSTEADPPFFGMGQAGLPAGQAGDHGAVSIWHWKAAWQKDLAGWQDIETAYPDAAVDWYPGQRDYQHGEPFEVRDAKTASQDPSLMAGWGAENPLSSPERTFAAEEAAAKGLGTLTSKPLPIQRVAASGEWREGRWHVVLRRPLASRTAGATSPERSRGTPTEKGLPASLREAQAGDLTLRSGQTVSVAFAVWDGQAEDRDGQKSVSIWNALYFGVTD